MKEPNEELRAIYDNAIATQRARNQYHARAVSRGRIIPHVIAAGGVEKKSCNRCGSLLDLDKFSRDAQRWDGLHPRCKDCEAKGRKKK